MCWLLTLCITFSLFIISHSFTYADPLCGKVEHNQLEASSSKIFACPQQPLYAQAISKSLAGFALNNALSASPQNTILKTSIQKNILQSEAKLVKASNQKMARTIQDVLANHDLAIIVDRSGSMATNDCPGDLSRWQWCSKQASELAQAAAQASNTITLMFFNNELQIFDQVNPKNIPTLFTTYNPAGGTSLSRPIIAQLDRYFSKRLKPLIIVVISDGIPQDRAVLAPMISDASNSLHYSGEVTISFLLIGNQVDSEEFKRLIGELDGGSIKNGGMVDVIGFGTLSSKGIKQTLFDELKTITIITDKSKPSQAEQFAVGRRLPWSQPTNPFSFYSSNALTNPFPSQSLKAALSSAK
jgi:hypothetical protein